jgi:methyl-accepting chemotaxis protein
MNLRNLNIGARLGVGFGIILAMLVLVITLVVIISDNNREKLTQSLKLATSKGTQAATMKSALLESGIAMRNIGLQTEVAAMQKEEDRTKVQRKNYADASTRLSVIGLTETEKKILADLAQLNQKIEAPLTEAMGHALGFNSEGAAKIIATNIDPITQLALVEINKLVDLQQVAINDALDATVVAGRNLRNLLLLIGFIALASGVGCAWVLTRSITRPLGGAVALAKKVADGDLSSHIRVTGKDETSELLQALKTMNENLHKTVTQVRSGTDTIATASRQIAVGNMDLSSRTEQQASSLEETAASMEELTSAVKQNADNAQQANQLAASASEVAIKGGAVVSQVVDTMASINDSSKKIVDIISVIDGIAFQTNILALNAAVEAARAGEQGRGFAVVATEVRNLAQRSAAAAKEIKALIGDSVEQVEAGSKLVGQAGATMDDVVASVRRVTDIMGEITAASREQSIGIEQVNQAIAQMDQVTQQNAALVEQAAAAAESLQDQATNLTQVISVFKFDDQPAMTELAMAATTPVAAARKTPFSRAAPARKAAKAAPARVAPPAATKPSRAAKATVSAGADEWEEF